MSCSMAALTAITVLILAASSVDAVQYDVGDSQGWNLGVNYGNWISGKIFNPGDSLLFRYDPSVHSVDEVSQSNYDSCSTSNRYATYDDGNTTIALANYGTRYFICGTVGHCAQGMKLAVTVSASGNGYVPYYYVPPPPNRATEASPCIFNVLLVAVLLVGLLGW